jgi:hypothetical protein
MNVEGISEACEDFVTELVQEALIFAEDNPDGFAPFGVVLLMDGGQWDIPDPILNDPDAALEAILTELSQSTESARCVAAVWDGPTPQGDSKSGAVFVEVHELGRPYSRMVAMGYQRTSHGVRATGRLSDSEQTPPMVPLTVDLVRRHLTEWAEADYAALRRLVWELHADTYGYDRIDEAMNAFDRDPRPAWPLLDQLLSGYQFGELDRDDAIALLEPAAQWIAEILIRVHGARWEVVADGDRFAHIVVLDGGTRRLDPYAFVAEYASAPLPSVADMARGAEAYILG